MAGVILDDIVIDGVVIVSNGRVLGGISSVDGPLVPSAPLTHSLGSSLARWNNVFTGGLNASGNALVGGTLGVGGILTLGASETALAATHTLKWGSASRIYADSTKLALISGSGGTEFRAAAGTVRGTMTDAGVLILGSGSAAGTATAGGVRATGASQFDGVASFGRHIHSRRQVTNGDSLAVVDRDSVFLVMLGARSGGANGAEHAALYMVSCGAGDPSAVMQAQLLHSRNTIGSVTFTVTAGQLVISGLSWPLGTHAVIIGG